MTRRKPAVGPSPLKEAFDVLLRDVDTPSVAQDAAGRDGKPRVVSPAADAPAGRVGDLAPGRDVPGAKVLGIRLPEGCLADGPGSVRARARVESPDAMNGTERRYAAEMLEVRRLAGELLRWDFQAIKLRLADDTWFTPDFLVMLADGTLELHEVKGGLIREDAMVKLKVAAEAYPFDFVLAQYARKAWKVLVFRAKRR